MKLCGQCAYWRYQGGNCPFLKARLPEINPACSRFIGDFYDCDLCHNLTPSVIIDITDETPSIVCDNCFSQYGKCPTCLETSSCRFQTDPSPLPKVVMKTIRNGNMTMQSQVKNPERVAITCEKGCSCFSQEDGCRRDLGSCENHRHFTTKTVIFDDSSNSDLSSKDTD